VDLTIGPLILDRRSPISGMSRTASFGKAERQFFLGRRSDGPADLPGVDRHALAGSPGGAGPRRGPAPSLLHDATESDQAGSGSGLGSRHWCSLRGPPEGTSPNLPQLAESRLRRKLGGVSCQVRWNAANLCALAPTLLGHTCLDGSRDEVPDLLGHLQMSLDRRTVPDAGQFENGGIR
jgi:hypothetical protein